MIIGITGPAGAGKDTAADYVAEKIGTKHVSGGDVLREMLQTLGLEPKKSALGNFGTFLRTHYGQNFVPEMAERKAEGSTHLVYSGFRALAEAKGLQEKGGVVLYIDAPDELRYARILSRRREHDTLAVADLKKLDEQERSSTEALSENLTAVREVADIVIMNDGTEDELHAKLDAAIERFVH